MMTEQEAKKRWCPMVRFSTGVDDGNASNRWLNYPSPAECSCIASGCMMWRWSEYQREWLGSVHPGGQCFWDSQVGLYFRETSEGTKGYCGLGGKP